jgi:hypothetical protein
MRCSHLLVAVGLSVVLSACADAATVPLQLQIASPALGRVTANVDGCRARPSLRALDLDANEGAITVRVEPDSADVTSWRFVVANRAGPRGPAEETFTAGDCRILRGFVHLYLGDVSFGLRMACATPSGGTVEGLVGAGRCRP